MSAPKPIPIPLGIRWREFRHRFVPALVFASVLCVSLLIWVRHAASPTLVGQVEAKRADVTTTRAGTIARLEVEKSSRVKANDPVAQVIITDRKVLDSSLAVIRAELDLLTAGQEPLVDLERNQLNFQSLRLDWLEQRTTLASSRVQLQYAQSEFDRVSRLRGKQNDTAIASESEYDLAFRDMRAAKEDVAERTRLLEEIEASMQTLVSSNPNLSSVKPGDVLGAAIRLQEKRLQAAEAELSPITLFAPIDGVVSSIYRRGGENVSAGDPIMTITSIHSDEIVSYLIPPLGLEPEVGMQVQVVARTQKRERARARIIRVGEYMEAVFPALLSPSGSSAPGLGTLALDSGNRAVRLGIPIAISMPAGLNLRPGELVDLSLLP